MALTALGERLALIIDAKTDGAVTNINRLTASEKEAADRADVLRAKIADLEARAAKRPLTTSAGLQLSRSKSELAGLESTMANIPQGAGLADKALAKLGLQGTLTGSALAGGLAEGAAAAAAFGAFEFLKHGVEEYTALTGAVRQFQQASGASAADSSRLVAVSDALGVSQSSAAGAVFRLGKNLATTPTALAAYGIATAKNADGTTNLTATLENVATAYQHSGDAAQRNAILYAAFGKSGAALLPIVNATRQQLEEIDKNAQARGAIFSQQDLKNAQDYQIATRELKDSFDALAVSAAKGLVPALTETESILTKIMSIAHNSAVSKGLGFLIDESPVGIAKNLLTGNYKGAIPFVGPFFNLFGHSGGSSGPSAEQKARAEQAQSDAQAAQDAIQQQVLATLASPFDTLAGPAAVQGAKQTLSGALTAVKNAKTEQAAALRALASAQAGGSTATQASLTAAQARVHAAELNLQKAQYVGGAGNIASARAGLLSAQSSLNNLRKQGAVNTNSLASAEDRLHRANRAVTEAEKKAADAQKGVNQARGLTARQAVDRLTKQVGNTQALANANVTLAQKGVTSEVIANLDQLNEQIPGTLVKVANTANKAMVAALNKQTANLDAAKVIFGDAAKEASSFRQRGKADGEAYLQGFQLGNPLSQFLAHGVGPLPKVTNPGYLGVLGASGNIVVQGDLVARGASARDVARSARREARRRALSGGGLRGPQ